MGATVMMAAAKAADSPVMDDLARLSGTMAFAPRTRASRLAGTVIQLVNGGLLAQGYVHAIRRLPGRSTWQDGLALGVVHGAAAGILLGVIPAVHPRVPEDVPPPGLFMSRRGAHGPAMLIALHAIFGIVVGVTIGDHPVSPAGRRTGDRLSMSHAG